MHKMSKITVLINDTSSTIVSTVSPSPAYIQADYLGNIYIKYLDQYYIVSLDSHSISGTELNLIKNPSYFKKNLSDYTYLKNHVRSGKIKKTSTSLTGLAHDTLTQMSEEEIEDYISNNDYVSIDPSFEEKRHYRVTYDDSDDILEGETDDNFYLNGLSKDNKDDDEGIMYSDLLCTYPGSFNTFLIDGSWTSSHETTSKNIISTIERIDDYCTSRLTIFTSGHFKANFIDRQIISQLCLIDDVLVLKKI